jgi:hypothetical protein
MVAVGNYRGRADLRKKPRRHFHYNASILTGPKDAPVQCEILDISSIGARIQLEKDCELPERFMLLLTATGDAHRRCRVVWREELTVGIEFPES